MGRCKWEDQRTNQALPIRIARLMSSRTPRPAFVNFSLQRSCQPVLDLRRASLYTWYRRCLSGPFFCVSNSAVHTAHGLCFIHPLRQLYPSWCTVWVGAYCARQCSPIFTKGFYSISRVLLLGCNCNGSFYGGVILECHRQTLQSAFATGHCYALMQRPASRKMGYY